MTDQRPPGPRARGDTLGLRLALAFLAVALAAVALVAGLTAAFAAADVSALATRQQTELTSAIGVAAGAAWDRTSSWAGADLSPVLDLAAKTGADVQIRDQAGHTIASSPGFAAQTGPRSSAPVVVRGQRIGMVLARSTGSGLGAADRVLLTALLRAIAGAAGLAALLALLTGLAVARRITRPVTRLIAVTRAMADGDRAVRAGEIRAPGELRELAAAFDQMAGTLDRQEQIRRDLVADLARELRTPIAILQAGHEALLDGVTEPTPAELARCAMKYCGWRAWSPTCRHWPPPTPPPCSWPCAAATWPTPPPRQPAACPGDSRQRISLWTGGCRRLPCSPTRTGYTR